VGAARVATVRFEVAFALAAALMALPLFAGRYVPIQDLPQHVAAVRVLHDYRVPALGFESAFELTPFATQYLAVYAVAHLLAYAFGALLATKLVIALSLIALPYALRALLNALGRPASFALLALPLVINAQLALGFLNFIAGIPLLIWGLALAVRFSESRSPRVALGLAAVSVVCFFTHVAPYALLVLGVTALAITRDLAQMAWRVVPLAPSVICAAVWSRTNPAGRALLTLSSGQASGVVSPPLGERIDELGLWLLDVVRGQENFVLWAWITLVGSAAGAGLAVWIKRRRALQASRAAGGTEPVRATTELTAELGSRAWLRLAPLVPLCWLGYFVLPASYSFIWPIHARFPLLALLLMIPLLPDCPRLARVAIASAAVALGAYSAWFTFHAFRNAAEREYAGLEALIARVPLGSKVAGLIFDPSSRYVKFSPYLHAVAWIQAERGGVVMFTFADFPVSPLRLREQTRPPRVGPRWEWMPWRVDSRRELCFYDYVLTRSARPTLAGFHELDHAGTWALWGRDLSACARP
jgi:hypothetical protein